jgi:hypothetical protein
LPSEHQAPETSQDDHRHLEKDQFIFLTLLSPKLEIKKMMKNLDVIETL